MKRRGLLLLALAILVVGLAGGAGIYVFAEEPEARGYVIIGDTAYPVAPASSKTYQRELQRYGGKMAVVFDDINQWIVERLQGKQLGITVAAASAATALVLFLAARRS